MRSPKGYSEDAKQICLKMYRDGSGFRAIERATGISHNTIINWVKQAAADPGSLSEPEPSLAVSLPTSLPNCAVARSPEAHSIEKDS